MRHICVQIVYSTKMFVEYYLIILSQNLSTGLYMVHGTNSAAKTKSEAVVVTTGI